jgi:hypothetical protein
LLSDLGRVGNLSLSIGVSLSNDAPIRLASVVFFSLNWRSPPSPALNAR